MGISEKAVKYHENGFNCCQAVFAACSELTGVDEKTALSIGSGFGGGLRCGEVCGSLSGAVMALSAAMPYNDSDDIEAKTKIAALTKQCCSCFREKFGTVVCRELLSGKSFDICDEFIAYAAELAERIIEENK